MSESEETPASRRRPRRKAFGMLAGAVLVLALAAGGAGYYLLGGLGGSKQTASKQAKNTVQHIRSDAVFHDLPMMLVGLRGTDRRVHLRLNVAVANDGDKTSIKRVTPRIMHSLRTYLTELDPADFRGTDDVKDLRRELLARIRKAASKADVQGILFRKLLVI